MRLNENTVIRGEKVILVPYRHEHVEKRYHAWMQSAELLELTASEPLSLEEEYAMQRKWHDDEDKLTFIILERPGGSGGSASPPTADLRAARMVGDVNLFLPDGAAGDGECEIMIAHADDRRRGFAFEALTLFLSYATTSLALAPRRLIARIGASNAPSIRLFERLGFAVTKHVAVWDEVEVRWGGALAGGEGEGEGEEEGEGEGERQGEGESAARAEDAAEETAGAGASRAAGSEHGAAGGAAFMAAAELAARIGQYD